MKKFFILSALALMATTTVIAADTKTTENTLAEKWTCTGSGTINTGGPGGVISMPVQGHGSTQIEAMNDAQQRCWSQGLQMCMINNCFKR